MYCLLCGILPDRIKYIWTPKAETQSTVKPASTPTKTAVPSTILCSLCYHAELSAITAGWAGGVHPLNSGPFPSKTPETWSISAVIFKSLNKTAVVLTVFFSWSFAWLFEQYTAFFEDFRTFPKMAFCGGTLTNLHRLLTKGNNEIVVRGIVGYFISPSSVCLWNVYEWCRDWS